MKPPPGHQRWKMASCKDCYFSRDIGTADGVACHRYPPTITKAEGQTVTAYFPLVTVTAWCGEYRRLRLARPLENPIIPIKDRKHGRQQ